MSQTSTRPFYDFLGLETVSFGDGKAVLRLPYNPQLTNSRGDVHGGAIAGLMDAALANAARAGLDPGLRCTTIQFTSHFLLPGRGTLLAEARTLRAGSSIVTAEATVTDAEGSVVATAIGTMKVLRPRSSR